MTERSAIRAASALLGPQLTLVSPALVVIEGHRIAAAGSSSEIDLPPERVHDEPDLTLLPGFIDAHVHIGLAAPADVLAGGVTAVRDLGWPPDEIFPLAKKSARPDFEGPHIVAAGPMLTAPGGYPTRAAWAPAGTGREVASAEEAAAAVDDACDRGAVVIKAALNPPAGPSLSGATLSAIVDKAHARGRTVSAHIWGLRELNKAITAGVDELAHMLMSPERLPERTLRDLVSRGTAIVPTLAIRYGKERRIAIDNLRRFAEAGGRIVYGTDLGNDGPQPGIDAREVKAMAEARLGGRTLIEAATVAAASLVKLPRKGMLAAGFDADIIGVRGDPLRRPMDCINVAAVWRLGRRFV